MKAPDRFEIEDQEREARIKRLGDLVLRDADPHAARQHWKQMREEIERRSPAQVARMEQAKELR